MISEEEALEWTKKFFDSLDEGVERIAKECKTQDGWEEMNPESKVLNIINFCTGHMLTMVKKQKLKLTTAQIDQMAIKNAMMVFELIKKVGNGEL